MKFSNRIAVIERTLSESAQSPDVFGRWVKNRFLAVFGYILGQTKQRKQRNISFHGAFPLFRLFRLCKSMTPGFIQPGNIDPKSASIRLPRNPSTFVHQNALAGLACRRRTELTWTANARAFCDS